ncbi:hypothetical protein [Streptacidiphilus sp. PAMC 29251]
MNTPPVNRSHTPPVPPRPTGRRWWRGAERPHSRSAGYSDGFTPQALDGFPAREVSPWLLTPDGPGLARLHNAWILATDGYPTQWITEHIDLPAEQVRVLVEAAHERLAHRAR